MVQDDEPVGLDGLRVEFDDERVVSETGVMVVATLAARLGIGRSPRSWCGCVAIGRAPRTRVASDGDPVRDGAGR